MADGVSVLGLSDEEFSKLPMPGAEAPAADEPILEAPVADAAGAVAESDPNSQQEVIPGAESEEGKDPNAKDPGTEGQIDGDGKQAAGDENPEGGAAQPKVEEQQKKEGAEEPKPEGVVPPAGSEPKPDGAVAPAVPFKIPTPEEATAFFMKVMTPIKANGKTIELRSPEEAIQLMQQGANYTQKMQAIAPHRKVLMMLEKGGLLDEDKLSFLIDVENGNPEAIQKLLKDKNVDVLSIDTESEPTYLGGNHKVSDNDVAFQTQLEELVSNPKGKETLQTINSTWDDASKEVLWGEPALMAVIHEQRENGIYNRITTEMDRRRVLGQITPETSFITAYKLVGDDLLKSGGFDDLAPKPAVPAPAPVPVATTAAAPKPVVNNEDKASAASPTRSTPKPAKTIVNPLAMSDEEFEAQFAQFQGRV